MALRRLTFDRLPLGGGSRSTKPFDPGDNNRAENHYPRDAKPCRVEPVWCLNPRSRGYKDISEANDDCRRGDTRSSACPPSVRAGKSRAHRNSRRVMQLSLPNENFVISRSLESPAQALEYCALRHAAQPCPRRSQSFVRFVSSWLIPCTPSSNLTPPVFARIEFVRLYSAAGSYNYRQL